MKEAIVLTVTMMLAGNVYSADESHINWGYSGHGGPKNWTILSADNFACSGKNQSPINLTGFMETDEKPIEFNYQQGGYEIVNNGHTIQVNYEKGSDIKLDGKLFSLLQVHFHAPSENHINGKSYPLEAHLVHADEHGNLAVVAIMFDQGLPKEGLETQVDKYNERVVVATASPNKWLKNIWSVMPLNSGENHKLSEAVNVADILPKKRDYYRFNGSLTTPPCSEGVRWLVLKEIVTVYKQQVDTFSDVLDEPNNRPLQPINARTVQE